MHFYQEVERRIDSLPGVQAAGVVAAGLPLERGGNNGGALPEKKVAVVQRRLSRDYSAILFHHGIPLRGGRLFAESDTAAANRVVIVNEAFAHAHFPGRNALGEHLYVGNKMPSEIVGVVGDVKSHPDQPAPPTTFVPAAQADVDTSRLFEAGSRALSSCAPAWILFA